jgi:hypothetical protein
MLDVDARFITRFWSRIAIATGDQCWEWRAGRFSTGYGLVTVPGRGSRGAHRVSWALTHGRWPTNQVLHHCDNPPCVRPDHLYEGDHRQNMLDRQSRGRTSAGEHHSNAKLTDQEVSDVRQRYAAGIPQKAIAGEFQVSQAQVSNIVRGCQRGGESVIADGRIARYTVTCERCGGGFQRKPGQRAPRFCSKQCQSAAQRRGQERMCLVCNKMFYRPPSAKSVTCSYACMGRWQTGTGSVRGERNGTSKVTDAQRDEIRSRRASGERVVDLCREYNLGRDQIRRICQAQPSS